MSRRLDLVIFGLSLSSSWGNGHATTFRALLKGLAAEGHRVLFLERDQPWYARHRDLPQPEYCDLELYDTLEALPRWQARIAAADAVIVGSYVPEGAQLIDRLDGRRPARLAFYDIDTPVTLESLRAGGSAYLLRRQLALFDLYLSFAGGAALEQLRSLGVRHPAPLYCAVDEDAYAPRAAAQRWDLGYLGTYSADRQPGLEALLIEPARRLPHSRFVVAGAQYPAGIDWPANVERIEHLPPAAHPGFYAAQRFTLNLTRSAMRRLGHAPSVRLFEAGACGTPVISDRWPGLTRLFPAPQAIALADGAGDVVAALAAAPEAARRTGRAARAITLAGHTGRHRARDLVRLLAEIPSTREVVT